MSSAGMQSGLQGAPSRSSPTRGNPTSLKEPFGADPRKCVSIYSSDLPGWGGRASGAPPSFCPSDWSEAESAEIVLGEDQVLPGVQGKFVAEQNAPRVDERLSRSAPYAWSYYHSKGRERAPAE
jgi:hypothetical protein